MYNNSYKLIVFLAVYLLLFFVVPENFAKPPINIRDFKDFQDLDKYADKYADKFRKDGNKSEVKKKASEKIAKPENRFIETEEPELNEADKRFVALHMKLANRHFLKKRYSNAENEITSVFSKQPSHSGAHFMKAVIAARKKQYDIAWYNILIANEKDKTNKEKITSFLNKLKTVSSEPKSPVWVKDIYREIPSSACDKCCDIIEKFLKTKISQNVLEITIDDFMNSSKATIPIKIKFSPEAPSAVDLKSSFLDNSNIEITKNSIDGNIWSANFEINDLPIENSKATTISDIKDFISGITEEIDVAILENEEYEPQNNLMKVNYKISARTFSVLNDFLRTISPYVKKYYVSSIILGEAGNDTIWKTEISVYYCVNNDSNN